MLIVHSCSAWLDSLSVSIENASVAVAGVGNVYLDLPRFGYDALLSQVAHRIRIGRVLVNVHEQGSIRPKHAKCLVREAVEVQDCPQRGREGTGKRIELADRSEREREPRG